MKLINKSIILCAMVSGMAVPGCTAGNDTGVRAVPANDFLSSIGVNSSIDTRGESLDKTLECMQYLGARWIRSGYGAKGFDSFDYLIDKGGIKFSMSIGTSVGTIVALTPLAAGIARETESSLPLLVAIVVGGAFFGDNLSFISDTTITATRTQGCDLKDKFKVNSQIVMPAAVVAFMLYIFIGVHIHAPQQIPDVDWMKVIPYVVVLVTAIMGLNVMAVLVLGLALSGVIGIFTGMYDWFGWFAAMGKGITGMGELIIITMMAGGMMEIIRHNGGIDYILNALTRRIHTKRGAELSIAALVCLINLCTANNTVAIITAGPLANDIATRFGVDKRKSASILDTFSCFTQGLIPYGAQLLMAAGLASVSPIAILPHLYYPFIMGACALLSILFRYPRKYS